MSEQPLPEPVQPQPLMLGPHRPWWREQEVPGLDPDMPVTDPLIAAQYTVIACAIRVLRPSEHGPRWLRASGEEITLTGKWFGWLTDYRDEQDAELRRFIFRQVCDSGIDTSHIQRTCDDLWRACQPRRR